jgi:hypothetical protein
MSSSPLVPSRDAAFDVVRGVLVMVMVVYHVMSIASTAGPEAYRYIRFISGAFIFLTGFIVTRFMRDVYARDPGRVTRRLLLRGLKVLALFTMLNMAIQASGFGNVAKAQLGIAGFFANAAEIYLVGGVGTTSFLVLLPIAYLLLIAPAVLGFTQATGTGGALALLSAALIASAWPSIEGRWPVVDFVLVGLTGMAIGLPAISMRLLSSRRVGWTAIGVGLPAAVAVAGWLDDPLLAYSLGVAMVSRLLHDLAGQIAPDGSAARLLLRLGQYSLLAYIAQIVIIQLLFRASGGQRSALGPDIVVQGLAAASLLIVLCAVVERLRHRFGWCDRAYRLVFA